MADHGLVAEQLATVELLQAMYSLSSELFLSSDTSDALDILSGDSEASIAVSTFNLTIRVSVDGNESLPVEVTVALPLTTSAGPRKILVRQPTFLPRSAYQDLLSSLPNLDPDVPSSELILSTIEHICTSIPALLNTATSSTPLPDQEPEVLERVWFWFPSLSSREKRKDLVDYAVTYSLTGFVLAGKSRIWVGDAIPEHEIQGSLAYYVWREMGGWWIGIWRQSRVRAGAISQVIRRRYAMCFHLGRRYIDANSPGYRATTTTTRFDGRT